MAAATYKMATIFISFVADNLKRKRTAVGFFHQNSVLGPIGAIKLKLQATCSAQESAKHQTYLKYKCLLYQHIL